MRDLYESLLNRFGIKVRGFEVVADWARTRPAEEVRLPERSTEHSAGYDIFGLEDMTILPGTKKEIATDIKVYMKKDEVCKLYPRSNQGITHDLMLANTTGVIDMDYYGNPRNDGSFTIVIRNLGRDPYYVKKGDKIAQAVFEKFLRADNDRRKKLPKRRGGIGSTGR